MIPGSPTDCSEAHRHRCEVATVARWSTDEQRAEFLALVEKKRGTVAAQTLRRAVWDFMKGVEHGKA